MERRPITLRAANAFVAQQHRHNVATRGWLFGKDPVAAVTVKRSARRSDRDGYRGRSWRHHALLAPLRARAGQAPRPGSVRGV